MQIFMPIPSVKISKEGYTTLSIENMWRNPMQSDILGVSLPSISIVIHRQGVPSANKLFVPRQAAFAESHNMCPKCLLGVVGVEFVKSN
jgi:hypothetical protein